MSVFSASICILSIQFILFRHAAPVAEAQIQQPDMTASGTSKISPWTPFSNSASFSSSPVSNTVYHQPAVQAHAPVIASPDLGTETVPDVVHVFARNSIQKIEADPELKKAFALSLFTDEQKFKDVALSINLNALSEIGHAKAEDQSHFISNALKENFRRITTESFIRLYAYSIGKFLFIMGRLTRENVSGLSQMFFEKLKESVTSVVDHTPEADVIALATGYFNFLKHYGLYTLDDVDLHNTIFTREWYKW